MGIVDTPTQHQLPRGDGLFGRRRESPLLDPMGYPIEIYGGIRFAIDTANQKVRRQLVSTQTPRQRHDEKVAHVRVGEPLLREELRDGGLPALEARLGLSVSRPRLLAFVSTTRGLAQTGAATATEAFLLRDS